MRALLWTLALLLVASGCAYPRRDTLTYAAPKTVGLIQDEPSGLYSIRLIGAELPHYKGAGLAWDSDGSGPDPFLRLLLDGRLVWESPAQENTHRPEWNITLPRNIFVAPMTKFRIEIWDKDTASSDPAGSVVRTGLPGNALPNAVARLALDNLGAVAITVSSPIPSKGVGLRFEIHDDGLAVLAVEQFSPAARAGIQIGDLITAIGDSRVETVGGDRAASLLSLAADRGAALKVTDSKGRTREARLDGGYLWLIM